ncbi:MAG: dihydrofolate reductase [Deltaproteobacteria bacterium]|nr:dihydrofolate reductase [Deltaproteobacteria bacterium]
MKLSILVATSLNNVIGYQNKLPWHLPEDLKHFKEITLGHSIVMGRKTFLSIGKPLPERTNLILTRNPKFSADGIEIVGSFDELLQKYHSTEEFFVIGGAEIYQQSLPYVQKIYRTLIHQAFPGDTFFPTIDWNQDYQIIDQTPILTSKSNNLKYQFIAYLKKQ